MFWTSQSRAVLKNLIGHKKLLLAHFKILLMSVFEASEFLKIFLTNFSEKKGTERTENGRWPSFHTEMNEEKRRTRP